MPVGKKEPFPLRQLLNIMDRAQAIHEASYVHPTSSSDGYYAKDEEAAANEAVREILHDDYPELATFITLADHWWNDIEDLRNRLIEAAKG